MSDFQRRDLLIGAGLAAGALAAGAAHAQSVSPSGYTRQPLPFDPKAVKGLSEKLLQSHYDNNYGGAVTRLGAIEKQLAQTDVATAPNFTLNGLKREELLATNSMILHEYYFASLAPGPAQPGAALARRIEGDFGSHDKWRAEFIAMGKAIGGGWVLLTYSPRRNRLVNQWASDHSNTIGDGAVIVAMDMYEHAYAMDYGANAGNYVTAYMGALTWGAADKAYAAATRV